jgi:hypothetical protein
MHAPDGVFQFRLQLGERAVTSASSFPSFQLGMTQHDLTADHCFGEIHDGLAIRQIQRQSFVVVQLLGLVVELQGGALRVLVAVDRFAVP